MRTPISCAITLLIAASAVAQDWTPDPNDPSLLVWLSADSGFSVMTDVVEDEPVTTVSWVSQATASSAAGIDGIVFSQTNAGYAPSTGPSTLAPAVFNSVTFDGADYLTSPYITPNAETGVWELDPTNPLVGQQTAFIVYRDVSTRSYATPLGTFYNGKGSYHGNVDDSSVFSPYADPATTQGAIYRNGTRMDDSDPGTAEYGPARPDLWSIDAYVATGALSQAFTTVGADSCNSAGTANLSATRGITGEIAEILLFNRELNAAELDQVGSYLSVKYRMPTAYSGSTAPGQLANSFFDFADAQGADNWSYGYGHGAAFTSADMAYEPTAPALIGAEGGHFFRSNEEDTSDYSVYPKIWNSGQHPENARSATRRWAAEATGWMKVTGHVAKYDTTNPSSDGVLGEVYTGEERRLAQDIGPVDGQGKAFTVYVPIASMGDAIDLSVGAKGSLNNDSTRSIAAVEAVDQAIEVSDLASDFAGAQTGGQNPNGRWSYFEVDTAGNQTPFYGDIANENDDPNFVGWGSPGYSLVRKNVSGAVATMFSNDQTPADAVVMHPAGPETGIGVSWTAPSDGTVDVAGFLALVDLAQGVGGVDWTLGLMPVGATEPTEWAGGTLQADNANRGR